MLSFCDVNVDNVKLRFKETVNNERHIAENSAQREFWACLQSYGKQMTDLLRNLSYLFASLYKLCDKYSIGVAPVLQCTHTYGSP